MAYAAESRWSMAALSVTLAFISASAVISLYVVTKKSRELGTKVRELEASLASSLKKTAAERQGRIRAQQALRKAVAEPKSDSVECTSYPMTPIGTIRSSFSTRNGTPRQSLLVPLARARLVFSARIPPASIEGLGEYSHCWVIYVFHLNTDLDKLWKDPSKSKFKAKVRVPRLKGERVGVFATRSPHRPCPIGLTIAKVEAIQGHQILLSGADLVDGTPVLDVKPYLPYCDSVQDATVPKWLLGDNLLTVASICFSEEFIPTLSECWPLMEKKSLYASEDEFRNFVKEVLSWDIRSVSQRNQPHDSHVKPTTGHECFDGSSDSEGHLDDKVSSGSQSSSENIIYHLLVDGLDVSYTIGCHGNVVVGKVELASPSSRTRSN
ncbi:tRNA (adenine(37)-N6)-methyltransferase isoform X1 [Benincasa hispida]|uniref:tRNA (adenine(37)-N6)-methyltransferase isoform X1 n=1 Tax=Benincasa hispida TaxID=102211 RepID=UPI001900C46F|nr:tRNA (adenine(37)-N6)-methyltransferase isoform X1 [Benincasa hispida]